MPLPYRLDSLSPYIDTDTMSLHYNKLLTSHIDSLNNILKPYKQYHNSNLRELVLFSHRLPEKIRADVRHHAGAIFNHNMFFYGISPDFCGTPLRALSHAVARTFGSYDSLLKEMRAAALSLTCPGWIFLASNKRKELKIISCHNNETTLPMNLIPIIALDMWEHAYCTQYENDREKYFDNWAKVINHHFAEELFVSVR